MSIVLSSHPGRARRKVVRLHAALLAGGVAAALAGCASTKRPEIVGSVPVDYRQTHPIVIDNRIESIDIPVSASTARLTGPVKSNILGFAQKFLESGTDVIAIVTPTGSPNAAAAAGRSLDVQRTLIAAGVARGAIQFRLYQAAPTETTAPIRIAYTHVGASTAPCGPWPDQVASDPQNRNYYNFGCATQQNLAAMVANPLDLLYPRAITPASAERRATVLDNYRQGNAVQSDYSKEPSGTIAKGVGN